MQQDVAVLLVSKTDAQIEVIQNSGFYAMVNCLGQTCAPSVELIRHSWLRIVLGFVLKTLVLRK